MEMGIWPSSENRLVFRKFIESAGVIINEPIDVMFPSPIYLLCSPAEKDYVEGVLALSLLFIFGGFVARADGKFAVCFSHDEWMRVITGDP